MPTFVNGTANWSKSSKPLTNLIDDMRTQHDWIKTNVPNNAYEQISFSMWMFHNPEDATAFKLRFGIKK